MSRPRIKNTYSNRVFDRSLPKSALAARHSLYNGTGLPFHNGYLALADPFFGVGDNI